jgi:hypothetical protein
MELIHDFVQKRNPLICNKHRQLFELKLNEPSKKTKRKNSFDSFYSSISITKLKEATNRLEIVQIKFSEIVVNHAPLVVVAV